MKLKVREMSWFKRRIPKSKPPKVIKFHVEGFERIPNHACTMFVEYDDGNKYELSARVHLNSLAKPERWSVQGLNAQGISVLIDIID
jgi:hypothetical protein